DRPKRGFSVPIAKWLRGPLRDWVENLISRESLGLHGFLDYDRVQQTWSRHLSGDPNFHAAIWDIVTFQSWWLAYRNTSGTSIDQSRPSEVTPTLAASATAIPSRITH